MSGRNATRPLGSTRAVVSEDAYGNGPVTRKMTTFRGTVRSGNSGGPLVDTSGRVLATVFAKSTKAKPAGGYGVPNAVVRDVLNARVGAGEAVSTGGCAD